MWYSPESKTATLLFRVMQRPVIEYRRADRKGLALFGYGLQRWYPARKFLGVSSFRTSLRLCSVILSFQINFLYEILGYATKLALSYSIHIFWTHRSYNHSIQNAQRRTGWTQIRRCSLNPDGGGQVGWPSLRTANRCCRGRSQHDAPHFLSMIKPRRFLQESGVAGLKTIHRLTLHRSQPILFRTHRYFWAENP